LKRLREWAGRAPERARELEQRVVAQATATVARRAPQMPVAPGKPAGAIAPARRLAEMPAPATGEQAQATELAEKVADEEAPATNGNVPPPPAEDAEAATATPNGTGKDAEEAEAATPADAEEPATGEEPATSQEPVEGEERPEAPAAVPPAAAAAAVAGTGQETEEHALDESGQHDLGETGEHDELDEHTDDVPAVAVPRMTPAQRVGVTPKPQPLPLRQSNPTATPAARRPATPPGRRPAPAAPKNPGKRSAGTIVLLAGLAVLLLGGTAFGLSQVLGSDDPTPPPNTSAPPPGQTPEGGGTSPSVPNEETTVGVLNGTTTNGLAGTIADQLVQEAGYVRGVTATNTRDQTLAASTVYYGQGFRAQGRNVAKLLGIDTVEPVDEETAALAPDANVIVLAGADQATE